MVGSGHGAPARTDAGGWAVQPRLRLADFDPIIPLLPPVPGQASARVVRHCIRLLAPRPRSAAQRLARHGAPAGTIAAGRDNGVSPGRPVVVPGRYRALRPA